jgi:putative transposase
MAVAPMARPRRIAGFDYRGLHRYFVTCCVLDRRMVFIERERVDAVAAHFLQQAERSELAVIAYCFMPDHVHLLAEGQAEGADLQSFVARAKQKSGFDFAAVEKRRLWQKGYHDRVLRDEEATPDVVRYIIENPVRAGIAQHPSEYEFWGSQLYSREELLEYIHVGVAPLKRCPTSDGRFRR